MKTKKKQSKISHLFEFSFSEDCPVQTKYQGPGTFVVTSSRLRALLTQVMNSCVGHPVQLGIRFCGEDESRELNGRYRHKNKPTDVLSFPPFEGAPGVTLAQGERRLLGDLLICVPVCLRQAKEHRHGLRREMEIMLIHGVVHLLGFDHERGAGAQRVMKSLEKALLFEWDSASKTKKKDAAKTITWLA